MALGLDRLLVARRSLFAKARECLYLAPANVDQSLCGAATLGPGHGASPAVLEPVKAITTSSLLTQMVLAASTVHLDPA